MLSGFDVHQGILPCEINKLLSFIRPLPLRILATRTENPTPFAPSLVVGEINPLPGVGRRNFMTVPSAGGRGYGSRDGPRAGSMDHPTRRAVFRSGDVLCRLPADRRGSKYRHRGRSPLRRPCAKPVGHRICRWHRAGPVWPGSNRADDGSAAWWAWRRLKKTPAREVIPAGA